jgi:leucyl-tRNA---protein transferase
MPNLAFYQSDVTPCPYLEGEVRQDIFTLGENCNSSQLQQLLAQGFRRSGAIIYRPFCPNCRACQPARVKVNDFSLSRSQRRCVIKNQHVTWEWSAIKSDQEHIELYHQYQEHQHSGSMNSDAEGYMEMFSHPECEVFHIDFRCDGRLVGVSIVDLLPDGLSSVYFYFSPDYQSLSLGTFSALMEIQECQRLNLSHWYIGYVIDQCPKMSYKSKFQPQERFIDGDWTTDFI